MLSAVNTPDRSGLRKGSHFGWESSGWVYVLPIR